MNRSFQDIPLFRWVSHFLVQLLCVKLRSASSVRHIKLEGFLVMRFQSTRATSSHVPSSLIHFSQTLIIVLFDRRLSAQPSYPHFKMSSCQSFYVLLCYLHIHLMSTTYILLWKARSDTNALLKKPAAAGPPPGEVSSGADVWQRLCACGGLVSCAGLRCSP
jgi:hypothetical protein